MPRPRRRWLDRLTLVLVLAASPAALAGESGSDVPKGDVAHYTFESSKVFPGTVRDYWVYVPRQYDPGTPACVYVNQDGIQYNAPAVFDELIHRKEMPVVVGVFVTPSSPRPPGSEGRPRSSPNGPEGGL